MLKAKGYLRIIQKSYLRTLIEFDQLCRQHNISYWLESGTLLGAVRNKGFIHHDDDLDLSMLYSDYQKLKSVIANSTLGGVLDDDSKSIKGGSIYISSKENEYLLPLEILIYRECKISLSYNEVLELNKQRHEISLSNKGKTKYVTDLIPTKKQDENLPINQSILYPDLGCFYLPHRNRILFYKDIFPLIKIEFEGYSFNAPNNIDMHLFNIYGFDWYIERSTHNHDTTRIITTLINNNSMDTVINYVNNSPYKMPQD